MSKNGGTMSNVSHIMSAIENHNFHEHQHADARSNDKIIQDIGTQAAMEAYLDLVMFSNPNVRRVCSRRFLWGRWSSIVSTMDRRGR